MRPHSPSRAQGLRLRCPAWLAVIAAGFAAAMGAAAEPREPEPQRVAIEVLARGLPLVRNFPVATGLLFAEGELRAVPGGRLVDRDGRAVPFQAEATGWWNERKTSIKWLLLRFKADSDQLYYFEPGGLALAPVGAPIATLQAGGVAVDTGPLQIRLANSHPVLLAQATLHGQPMLADKQPPFVLSLWGGKGETRTTLLNWAVELEEATALHASVKATGYFHSSSGWSYAEKPVAKLEVRYEFFRGESFVRVFHTLTWMVANFQVGAREISLGLQPVIGEGTARLGVADGSGQSWSAPWNAATRFVARQDEAEHFAVHLAEKKSLEGKKLGGWMQLEGQSGRAVSVALRHAWQTYPKAFVAGKGQLSIQLWPAAGPSMSFTPLAIMTPEFFYHRAWKVHPWTREEGHFVHERAPHEFFQYTAEGAARTHELTLSFHDRSTTRSSEEINVLTQRPLVLRQSPASAMRVPFMGFQLVPAHPERHPEVERAVDLLGRMAMGRWAAQHEYGLWRFGLTRWGAPENTDNGSSLYRWMEGSQYDQTLIPWLLYLRGGDRQFLEEAEITSRFLMDVGVNHYNSRGYPTGYMATAGGTPFPYIPFHNTKGTKVHFLSYYYHLTGYKRAWEVMQEVINGTLATTEKNPEELPPWFRRTGGREAYNMNVFWVNAYQETWDPRLKQFAGEWMNLSARREYVPALNEFRPPRIYLYNGLVLQQRLWNDAHLQEVMLRNLKATVLTEAESGVERHVENVIGSQWAYEKTQDRRYAELAADVAQTLSDIIPAMDFGQPKAAPYPVRGNEIYRQFLLPILVGASLGDQTGVPAGKIVRRDTFFSLGSGAKGPATVPGVAYVRPRRAGDLSIFVRLSKAGERPVALVVTDPQGPVAAQATLTGEKPTAVTTDGEGYELLEAHPPMARLLVRGAQPGRTYKLQFTGMQGGTCALIEADAQVVHQAPASGAVSVHDLGGQYYGGARIYAQATEDVVTVVSKSPARSPYVVRDAATGELLFRSTAGDAPEQRHRVGRGRMILFVVAANTPHSEKIIRGVAPYLSAARDDWFDPAAPPPAR